MSIVLRSVLTVLVLSQVSLAQEKWCNKNYQADQPIVPPGAYNLSIFHAYLFDFAIHRWPV